MGACLQSLAENLVILGTAHVAGAGEGEADSVQRSGGQQLGRVVDQRRVGKGAHRLQGDCRVHEPAGSHHPQRNARGVDGDTGRRHGGKLRLRADRSVRDDNAEPGAEAPTIRLPHACLLLNRSAWLAEPGGGRPGGSCYHPAGVVQRAAGVHERVAGVQGNVRTPLLPKSLQHVEPQLQLQTRAFKNRFHRQVASPRRSRRDRLHAGVDGPGTIPLGS